MSGGGGTTQTIQKSEPPAYMIPYLKDVLGSAQGLYRSGAGQSYFPGSTVVPFAPQSEIALSALENRALAGSPITAGAQGLLSDTLAGDYLDPTQNPMWGRVSSDITDRVNTSVGLARRAGSPAHAEALARGLSEGAASLYEPERARQMQGLLMAPSLEGMDLADIQRMQQIGAVREAKAGETVQDQMNRYFYNQDAPWSRLGQYSGIVGGYGGLGQSGFSQQEAPSNTLGNVLGGGLLGYGLLSGGLGTSLGLGALGGPLGLLGGAALGLF